MKLDDNCIYAVLEAVEAASTYYDSFCYTADGVTPKQLQKFNHDQIVYHIHHCDEAGYLDGCSILGNGGMITVNDLSKAGHEYLKEVRGHTLWGVIKSAITECRNKGLKATVFNLFEFAVKWLNPFQ